MRAFAVFHFGLAGAATWLHRHAQTRPPRLDPDIKQAYALTTPAYPIPKGITAQPAHNGDLRVRPATPEQDNFVNQTFPVAYTPTPYLTPIYGAQPEKAFPYGPDMGWDSYRAFILRDGVGGRGHIVWSFANVIVADIHFLGGGFRPNR